MKLHKAKLTALTAVAVFAAAGLLNAVPQAAAAPTPAPAAAAADAAEVTVTGTVVDAEGEPLIGASVMVKGTRQGTSTDIDGHFTIRATQGATITVSSVGFTPATVKASATPLTITLQENAKALSEVVVTALGIKREQKALAYNVQKVDGQMLTANKDANFINSLAGKVPGVTINSSAAGAGSSARVVMRGTKSLTKDDNALYVIDGIPMFNTSTGSDGGGTMSKQPGSNAMADINPDDIESMSVLTGPSAAALYGSDAASGVILITTKKGQEGRAKLTYSNSTNFSRQFMMPKFQTTYGSDGNDKRYSWGTRLAVPTDYDPADFFRTGFTEINSLSLTTGTAKNQTYASAAATNVGAIMPNSDYNRYNFAIRNTSKFLSDKMTLDLGAQYVIQNNKNFVGSGEYFNPLAALYLFPRSEDFAEMRMYERWDAARNLATQYYPEELYSTALNMQNPYWIQNRMNREAKKKRYMFNASLQYDILPYLYVIGRVRVDNTYTDYTEKYYASTRGTFTQGSDKGFYRHNKTNDESVYADAMANFNRNFLDDRLSVNAQLGGSINDVREDFTMYEGGLKDIPNFFHYGNIGMGTKVNEIGWHDQTQSLFASAEVGWDHQVYLTLTGRNDWASMLAATDKNSYFYPSVGGSWLFSETFHMPSWLSLGKVRASWAEVASAPSRFLTIMQYSYNEATGQYEWPKTHYDPNLKPEKTRSWEAGMDLKFLNGRIGLGVTYYHAETFNQTFYIPASASSGYANNLVQTGKIRNHGVEASLNYNDTFGDWRVETGLTYSLNRNKVVELANGAINPETGLPIEMDYFTASGCLGMSGGPAIRLTEGGSMGDLYTNLRLRQSPNGYIWRDPATGAVALEQTEDFRKIGSLLPNFNMGWTGSVGWRQLTLSWAVTGRFGGKVISDTEAMLDRFGVSQRTADARDAGGVPIEGNGTVSAQSYYETISQAPGTYYVYSATNVRLADLTLAYQIPRRWLANVADVTLSLTGKNLWMIYCKAPFDPESTSSTTSNFYQGVDYFQQPSLRQFGFNVKLSF